MGEFLLSITSAFVKITIGILFIHYFQSRRVTQVRLREVVHAVAFCLLCFLHDSKLTIK